jgi:hypothetical protein
MSLFTHVRHHCPGKFRTGKRGNLTPENVKHELVAYAAEERMGPFSSHITRYRVRKWKY